MKWNESQLASFLYNTLYFIFEVNFLHFFLKLWNIFNYLKTKNKN